MTGERKTMLGAVAIVLAMTPGCMTRMQGRQLQTSVADLRLRLDGVDKLDQTHKEQVVQLRTVLDEATALLTANSNDLGAKERKSETDIAALQTQIERHSEAIDQ